MPPTKAESEAAMELQRPVVESPALTFEPETHTYRIDGQVVPSVTQILSEAGLVDGQWYTEQSQHRGRLVHLMTALDDQNELNEEMVHGEYQGYLNAWRRFKAETKCEILAIEQRVYNCMYRYAGTTDRLVSMHSLVVELLDIKTGGPEWWHKFQTAGYWMCDDIQAARRGSIYLSPDGTYKIKEHEAHGYDTDVFRAALTLANAKRNEGITNDRNRSV